MAEGGSLINVNHTVFFHLVLFYLTFFVYQRFVAKPFLYVFKKREEKTTALKSRAHSILEKAEKIKADYEAFMQEKRVGVSMWMEDQKSAIGTQEKNLVDGAKKQAEENLFLVREKLKTDLIQAESELKNKTEEFSSLIVSRVLGRVVHLEKTTGGANK